MKFILLSIASGYRSNQSFHPLFFSFSLSRVVMVESAIRVSPALCVGLDHHGGVTDHVFTSSRITQVVENIQMGFCHLGRNFFIHRDSGRALRIAGRT